MRTMYRILKTIYIEVGTFIDDIDIKESRIDYNREEIVLDIRRFMKEYIVNINKILFKIKYTKVTISVDKT